MGISEDDWNEFFAEPLVLETEEQWLERGEALLESLRKNQWLIGDWLCDGSKYDDPYYGKTSLGKAADRTGYDIDTLRTFRRVAAAYPVETRRRVSMPWSYFEAAAALEDEEVRDRLLLDWGTTEGRTIKKFREAVKRVGSGSQPDDVGNDGGLDAEEATVLSHVTLDRHFRERLEELAKRCRHSVDKVIANIISNFFVSHRSKESIDTFVDHYKEDAS